MPVVRASSVPVVLGMPVDLLYLTAALLIAGLLAAWKGEIEQQVACLTNGGLWRMQALGLKQQAPFSVTPLVNQCSPAQPPAASHQGGACQGRAAHQGRAV